MTSYTTESWSIDGVELTSYAIGLEAVEIPTPRRRGEGGATTSYLDGVAWQESRFESRTLGFSLWATDRRADGTREATDAARWGRLYENVAAFAALIGEDGLRTLTTVRQLVSGIRTMTVQGQFRDSSSWTKDQNGLYVMRASANFFMPDPFFYGAEVLQALNAGGNTVTNAGQARTLPVVTMVGPLTNPSISMPGSSITYLGSISFGHEVTIDCALGSAVHSVSGNVASKVVSTGGLPWLPLRLGSTAVTRGGTGSGTISLTFAPPYLV